MTLITDSSFLIALYNTRDARHETASAFAADRSETILVPDVVLPEVNYLLRRDLGYEKSMNFLTFFDFASVKLASLEKPDLDVVKRIAAKYADAQFDIVDCCIMAIAERLDITRIATFDRRDFSMVKLARREYLELLP